MFRIPSIPPLAGAVAVALTAVLNACGSSTPPPAPAAAPAPRVFTASEREAFYKQCWELFNSGNFDEFSKCYASDVTSQQLGYGPPSSSGAAAVVASSQNFKKGFPDGRGEAVLTLINGDRLISVHVLHGTNSGSMSSGDGKEMPATNKPLSLMFAHHVEVSADALKVKREIGIMDSATMATQLGLSKLPARPLAPLPAAGTATTVIGTNDAAEQANLQIDQATFDAWNKRDNKAMADYLADDYVVHDFSSPKDMGKQAQLATNKEFWGAYSDARLTSTLWTAGNYVVAEGTFSGTNDGPMPSMKMKKTGNHVEVPYLQIDRLEGGKIKEEWLFLDNGSFAAQLMAKAAAK